MKSKIKESKVNQISDIHITIRLDLSQLHVPLPVMREAEGKRENMKPLTTTQFLSVNKLR